MDFGSSLGGFLGGMFGDSGAPYRAAGGDYQRSLNDTKNIQNPFYNAGVGAINPYQNWLQGMSDPSGFINHLMNNYQQSPWAKYQQQQGNREAQNFGSASGLTGSTPLMMQAQQNAQNIGSQDMNEWLQNVLGINSQYGQGYGNLLGAGQNAANSLTGAISDYGHGQAAADYGNERGKQNDFWNMIGGGLGMFGL